MGWFTKEAKAFGRELGKQGSILLFGKAPRPRRKQSRKKCSGAERQYRKAKRWARSNGFI